MASEAHAGPADESNSKRRRRASPSGGLQTRHAAPTMASFEHPLASRYSSAEMSCVWSPHARCSTWRRLWVALATAQKELGLSITDEQITAMKGQVHNIDFEFAQEKERELRHDVMSHIHAFAKECPVAKPIIHLGATSCFVTDNGDLIQMRQSLGIVLGKLLRVIRALRDMAVGYRSLPTLGFTHFQPAQLTTVGKRTCLWLQDFVMDYEELLRLHDRLPFRGVKGTTGTQASFLELFNGDHEKVRQLDRRVAELMGFSSTLIITGQTYTRKIDSHVLNALAGIAQSAHKAATDLRLLANLRELEEPLEEHQVGSSAMAYKCNPMRCERVCSLARYVMCLAANTAHTHAVQWLERTLDDSANRRMVLPEAFMATDGILDIVTNIISGIRVWPFIIRRRVMEQLPFMATENIIMECVKRGGDRQVLHEAIRVHSMETVQAMKMEGADNDLLSRISRDPLFAAVASKLDSITDPTRYIGRSSELVDEYISQVVDPLLVAHSALGSVQQAPDLRV